MKKTILSVLLAGAAGLALTLQADAQGQQALVIQGGTLIDGNGGAPVANSVIVIQGNRIAAVGRAGSGAGACGCARDQCRRQMDHARPDRRQGELELDVWRRLSALGRDLGDGDRRAQRPGHRRARCHQSRHLRRPAPVSGRAESAGRRTGRQAARQLCAGRGRTRRPQCRRSARAGEIESGRRRRFPRHQ